MSPQILQWARKSRSVKGLPGHSRANPSPNRRGADPDLLLPSRGGRSAHRRNAGAQGSNAEADQQAGPSAVPSQTRESRPRMAGSRGAAYPYAPWESLKSSEPRPALSSGQLNGSG